MLDEDRSLPDDWITLVQDQVNLTRNGQGDVSLRLSPPLNAEPGDYPFAVTLGPQGGILTPRSLTLTVQATPAVKLTTKEKSVKIGPIGSFADFHLTAESAGNADTAFRVAVQPPPSDSDGSGAGPVPSTGPRSGATCSTKSWKPCARPRRAAPRARSRSACASSATAPGGSDSARRIRCESRPCRSPTRATAASRRTPSR